MILNKIDKQTNLAISESLSKKLIKHPHFMLFCPSLEKREEFIKAYMHYYLYEWAEYDILLCNNNKNVFASLIDPKTFEYKFKGKGALKLKNNKCSKTILTHRKDVKESVDIIIPPIMNPRVLNIYATLDSASFEDIQEILNDVIKYSNDNGCAIMYETFSQRLILNMKDYGFEIAFQSPYNNTRFLQTIMVYYPEIKKAETKEEYPD